MSVAPQAPLFMGFPRQEYWSGLPFPSPGDLPYPGIELGSLALQADSLLTEPPASVLAYTSNKPEGGFQNGTCQHQVPHSRMSSPEGLLLASVSPRVNSNCFLHLQETLQISLGLTLSNPMDCSLPGSSIHGIFQARVLEWGAIAFSKSETMWQYLDLGTRIHIVTHKFLK